MAAEPDGSKSTTWLQLRERVSQLASTFGLPACLAKQDAEVAKAGAAAVCPTTAPPDTVPKKVSFQ